MMRDDLPAPAVRLLASLPVRTHIHQPEPISRQLRAYYERTRRVVTGVGRGGNQGKRVRIVGIEYRSMKEACKRLKISHKTFYKMIFEGTAKRID